MGRRDGVRSGTAGGCLFNGCLAVLVLLLVCVIRLWIWAATADDRAEGAARADMRRGVETRQEKLVGAAADGVLEDSEIARVFPQGKPAQGLVRIERRGPDVIVTAELLGVGPGVFLTSETLVNGCFTFTVTPDWRGHRRPEVTIRELAVDNEPRSACSTPGVSSEQ
ncbi:hypothetical protein [Streptomyces europaeiscabiei]|uniref:hypothetical protein n=1 Tax=Streptomyces europaeiscabiei TaxID=146819 RepID=UPI0029A591AB|nr:hypothetical protein [Streptomyces europaeiscabiei]MDX2773070.1 hypothetical protein [Streptomyces europaeiscabiei]